mgnify:CR=1 FL=1
MKKIISILLGICLCGGVFAQTQLKIISFNIHAGYDAPIADIAAFIKEQDPDIVALQEVDNRSLGIFNHDYLSELAESLEFEELVNAFWDQNMKRIKPWYEPREDDVILTASFDITVGEACRRLGVQHLVSSTIDGNTLNVNYLNFNTNKPKRFRELYGDNVRVDEFYTDSRFDQPMIDMARRAYMVKGNKIHQVK